MFAIGLTHVLLELQKQLPTRFVLQHGIAGDKQDAHVLWQHFLMSLRLRPR